MLVRAERLANELHSPAIRRHHLLIGLLDGATEGSQTVAVVLADADVDSVALRTKLLDSLRATETPGGGTRPFTREAKKTLELSLREALSLGHNYIGREHLLLGILRSADGPLQSVIADTGLGYERAREIVAEQSPPSGRGRGGRRDVRRGVMRTLGRQSTVGLQAVLQRAHELTGEERNATTGDLLLALVDTPGSYFASMLQGVALPDRATLKASLDRLLETKAPDGTDEAVKVDARSGAVTINDPRIAEAVKKLVGDGAVTSERLEEILRRLQG
ncbi:MAG TPA: Clp protease N-terminal domain-containing protein [Acidimicrobiales bacterium]|nr:Clp protease N-terminal domain-containing protein [Acidimicrobiales bacterium]